MSLRKTARQRQEEEGIARWREQLYFERAIRQLDTLEEALAFVEAGPRQGEPGGELYTNFGAFLRHGHLAPSSREQQLHAEFDQRRRMKKSKAQ